MFDALDVNVAMIAMAVTPAVSMLLVLDGSGRARGGRWVPRGGRDVFALLVIATAALPAGLLAGPLVVAIPLALAAALLARVPAGPSAGLGILGALSASVVVIDVALGAPLLERASLGSASGRIDPFMVGVAIGGALAATAVVFDRARASVRPLAAAGLAACVGALIAPAVGNSASALWGGIPAVAAFALVSAGPTVPVRRVVVGALGAAASIQLMVLVGGEGQRWASEVSWLGRDTAHIPAVLIAAAALAIVFRLGDARARAMFGRPHARAAVLACIAGAIGSGSTLTAAALLGWAAALGAIPMLGADEPMRRRRPN